MLTVHENQRRSADNDIGEVLLRAGIPLTRSQIINAMANTKGLAPSPATVLRRLDSLIERGLVARKGGAGHATYSPTPRFKSEHSLKYIKTPVSQRPKVPYNKDWVDAYIPNQSRYLSEESSTRLRSRLPPGRALLLESSDSDIRRFMCDLAFASSKLEGNDYDLASTYRLLNDHIEKIGGTTTDRTMLLNHYDAISVVLGWLKDSVDTPAPSRLKASEIRSIHAILSNNLLPDPRMCGKLRVSHVEIRNSAYIPIDIPPVVEERFHILIDKAALIDDPFEQAFFLLAHISYLQPFEDVNKRTARVSCNLPLLRAGLLPISWLDTPQGDYIEAKVSLYETQDTYALEQVFVDAYLRSAERFQIAMMAHTPTDVSVTYRQQIREAIRAEVTDQPYPLHQHVPQGHAQAVMSHVANELQAIKDSPFSAVRFGLDIATVESWIERQSPMHPRDGGG